MLPTPSVQARGLRGVARTARLAGLVVGLLAALAGPPGSAVAVTAIPAEPGAMLLNAPTYGAIVGDVAGDGSRDLVRLVAYSGDSGQMAVDVWRRTSSGWADLGEAPLRRGVGVDEKLAQTGLVGKDGMRPVHVTDAARLLIWRDGTRDRVLVAVTSTVAYPPASPCCLTLWEVRAPASGPGPTTLHLLLDTQRPATAIQSLDMDGDGIDELLFEQPPEAGQPGIRVGVLDWSPSTGTFQLLPSASIPAAAGSPRGSLRVLGESDGRAGAEAALVVPSGSPSVPSLLVRISLRDGQLFVEEATIRQAGTPIAVETASGPRIVVAAGSTASLADGAPVVVTWPSGWPATARSLPFGAAAPLAALGSGVDTRILFGVPGQVVMGVADGSLNALPGVTAANAAAPFLATALLPYVGPFPGGLPDGTPAVVFGGKLVRTDPNPTPANQGLRVSSMAALPGMAPLGWLGPSGSWTALLVSLHGSVPADEVARSGGTMATGTEYAVTLAPTADVMAPEEDRGRLQPPVAPGAQGSVSAGSPAGGQPTVLTRDGMFTARLDVPSGSVVRGLTHDPNGLRIVGSAEVPADGATGSAPPYTVLVGTPVGGDRDQRYSASISVVTPAGHGYVAAWTVWAYRQAPPLAVGTASSSFGFAVEVTGQTSAGSTVSIDGRSVSVAADGSFTGSVQAGPFPSEVTIVASDAFGNRTERVLSVVAPFDYRRLPWVPIIVGITLLIAGAFVIRVPRGRGARGGPTDGWIDDDYDGPIDEG